MFEEKVTQALLGRPLTQPWRTKVNLYGSDLGFGEGDIHHLRIYQLALTPDSEGNLKALWIGVVGELISPCSGYFPEVLDEFDHRAVIDHCLSKTEA